MSDSTQHVSGLEELAAAFRRVSFNVWKRVLRKMAGSGAKVARDAMRAAAPVGVRFSRRRAA
jgi:hypothetical protein